MSQTLIYLEASYKKLQEAQQALQKAETRYSSAQEAAYQQGTHEADVELETSYELYQEKCGEVAQCEASYKRLLELAKSE